jgi:hypothetical protein
LAYVVLDSWTALGILLLGVGIGALLTKIQFFRQMRRLRAEIEAHRKSDRDDDIHLAGGDETHRLKTQPIEYT